MSGAQRDMNQYYRPEYVRDMSEEERKAEVDRMAIEISRLEDRLEGLRDRRRNLLTWGELFSEDRRPHW